MNKIDKKECEQVTNGSWYKYFLAHDKRILFNDEIMHELDELVPVDPIF